MEQNPRRESYDQTRLLGRSFSETQTFRAKTRRVLGKWAWLVILEEIVVLTGGDASSTYRRGPTELELRSLIGRNLPAGTGTSALVNRSGSRTGGKDWKREPTAAPGSSLALASPQTDPNKQPKGEAEIWLASQSRA